MAEGMLSKTAISYFKKDIKMRDKAEELANKN